MFGSLWSLLLLVLVQLQLVHSQCPANFNSAAIDSRFCYRFDPTRRTWSEAYDYCRHSLPDGNLMEISSFHQWQALTKAEINQQSLVWIGANRFGRGQTNEWHWLDGSTVDSSISPWCPDSPSPIARAGDCLAYDPSSKCLQVHSCQRTLAALCMPLMEEKTSVSKSILLPRQTSSGTCGTVYAGSYGSWWTYAMLLLNWFALFCFVNYLTYRLLMNKRTAYVMIALGVLSLISIIAFAVLWALQYRDVTRLPLAVVVIGSFASLILLFNAFILVSNRLHVRRSLLFQVFTILAFIIQCGLMVGIAICFAFCTGYISLPSTLVEKDIIAAILASITPAISIVLFTAVLYLIGHPNDDRLRSSRSNTVTNQPATTNQREVIRPAGQKASLPVSNSDKIERATSPVDARILEEFYTDRPREMHSYQLNGRRYVVFEGRTLSEQDSLRRELTQAILSHESQALHEALNRAKKSVYAPALAEEIERAEDLIKTFQ